MGRVTRIAGLPVNQGRFPGSYWRSSQARSPINPASVSVGPLVAVDASLGEALPEHCGPERRLAYLAAVPFEGLAQVGGRDFARHHAPLGDERAEHVLVLPVAGSGMGHGGGLADPVALPGQTALDGPREDAWRARPRSLAP